MWRPQDQQLQLICSLFLDIPIGSILVLDKLEDIGMRDLCFQKELTKKEPSTLLMDGQQRISTIKSVFSDLYKDPKSDWKKIHESLHSKLKFRWFLDLSLNIEWEEDKLNQKLKLLYDFYWNHKFEDYDLEDIGPIIINKKILANSSERWHPSKDTESLANYCAEENLLPLFLVLSNSAVLKSIIEKIACKYIQFLRDHKSKPNIQAHRNDLANKTQLNIDDLQKQQDIINKIYTNVQKFFNNHIEYKEIYGVEYNKSHLNKAIVAFNTMNTGGISLGVFDIISAKYSTLKKGRLSNQILQDMETAIEAIEDIDDPDIVNLIRDKFVKGDKSLITKNFSDMYLNMLSIFLKLASSYTSENDIFKHCASADKKIQIKHFANLHKDHIIPSSWIAEKKNKNSPVDSVLNKFYSPSKRNQQS